MAPDIWGSRIGFEDESVSSVPTGTFLRRWYPAIMSYDNCFRRFGNLNFSLRIVVIIPMTRFVRYACIITTKYIFSIFVCRFSFQYVMMLIQNGRGALCIVGAAELYTEEDIEVKVCLHSIIVMLFFIYFTILGL